MEEEEFVGHVGPSLFNRLPLPPETIAEIRANVAKLPPLSQEERRQMQMCQKYNLWPYESLTPEQKRGEASVSVRDDAKKITDCVSFCPLDDRSLLGDLLQEQDRNLDFATGWNYQWWYYLGLHFDPRIIVEIGTRFGYSLHAITQGTRWCEQRLHIFDAELNPGDKEPLKVFEDYFRNRLGITDLHVNRVNTQTLTTLGITEPVDMAIVDADHSEAGCYHDCVLAWEALKPGGVVVIDDTNAPGEPQRAVERFCRERNLEWAFLPSLRGIHLVRKPE